MTNANVSSVDEIKNTEQTKLGVFLYIYTIET